MTKMIRKQIYIPKRQQTLLKRLAKARGTSESEIIRTAIDRYVASVTTEQLPFNEPTWKQARALIEQRRQLGQPGEAYQWRREDAYEERLNRFEPVTEPNVKA